MEKLKKDEEEEHGDLKEPLGELAPYIEWEGGKLANRTHYVEISIDDLRVDSRETIIKKRKYMEMLNNNRDKDTIDNIDESNLIFKKVYLIFKVCIFNI